MKNYLKISLIVAAVFFLESCRTVGPLPAETKAVAAKQDAPNTALMVSAGASIADIAAADLKIMEGVYDSYLKSQGFESFKETEVTKASLQKMIKDAARRVSLEGTLFFYYVGHGGPGFFQTTDGKYSYQEMMSAIKSVRSAPIKRFVFVLLSCFSGSSVSTFQAVNANSKETIENFRQSFAAYNELLTASQDHLKIDPDRAVRYHFVGKNVLFQEVFVLTAANQVQTASAATGGSPFALAVRDSLESLKKDSPGSATFRDFATLVQEQVKKKTNGERPQVYEEPEGAMGRVKLFEGFDPALKTSEVEVGRQAAAKDWLAEVSAAVDAKMIDCKLSVKADLEPVGYFFSPVFVLSHENGTQSPETYLGTFNFLSQPESAAELILRKMGVSRMDGCTLQPS